MGGSGNLSNDEELKNCSDILPISEEFFKDVSDAEIGGIITCGVISIFTFLIFAEQAHFIIHHYETSRSVMHRSLQIFGTYSVISMTSMLAVCVPRATLVCDLVGSVYIALSLYNFTLLVAEYFGGEDILLSRLEGETIRLQSPPVCCCCFCLPTPDLNRKNFQRIRLLVLQNAFIQPVFSFLTVVLWLDNKYVKGKIEADNAYIYLATVTVVSTLFAMYGLTLTVRLTVTVLQPLFIRPKFFALQLVLIFHNFQSFIALLVIEEFIPECRGILSSMVRGRGLIHLIVVGEMFLLSILARCLYRRPHGNITTSNPYVDESKEMPESTVAIESNKGSEGANNGSVKCCICSQPIPTSINSEPEGNDNPGFIAEENH